MQWTVAVVAALLMAGCASNQEQVPQVGIAATDLEVGNITQTVFPLIFAGGTREASLAFTEVFGPADGCLFGFPECPASSQRTFDLTPAVPAEAPVELTIQIDGANVDFRLATTDTTVLRSSDADDSNGNGLSVLLVRSPAGTVLLEVSARFNPDPDGSEFSVTVQSVTRANVVPSGLPVAVKLAPGDVVNATADGLEQFVAFPPSGAPIRAVQYPFTVAIPQDGPTGTWILIGLADEALRLTGPNQTLSARLLEFTETPPVDIAPNQATSFTMDIPGYPLHAGVGFQSKRIADSFFGGLTLLGNNQVTLVSPDRVDVLDGATMTCSPGFCRMSFIGGIDGLAYSSGFLNEYLVPGSYEATVTMETSNDVQAYGWALAIRTTA